MTMYTVVCFGLPSPTFLATYHIEAETVQAAVDKVIKMHKPNTIMVVGVFEGELDNLLDA